MAMTGIVHAINPRRGMVAIATNAHGFTIIELLGADDIQVGDELAWANDTALGSEKFRNITKGIVMNVFVQNHWVSADQLRQQLLMT